VQGTSLVRKKRSQRTQDSNWGKSLLKEKALQKMFLKGETEKGPALPVKKFESGQ